MSKPNYVACTLHNVARVTAPFIRILSCGMAGCVGAERMPFNDSRTLWGCYLLVKPGLSSPFCSLLFACRTAYVRVHEQVRDACHKTMQIIAVEFRWTLLVWLRFNCAVGLFLEYKLCTAILNGW